MEHLLFAGYLILFSWLVTIVPFFKKAGLTSSQLIIIFLFKVMAGIFYGWIGVYYANLAQMIDTWFYHYTSIEKTGLLLSNPSQFFAELFTSEYVHGYGGFLASENSWWNDVHTMLIIRFFSIFNLLSFGHYYTNVIFYSFLTLFGPMAIYRVMKDVYPTRKAAVFIATFFVPSFIYWTSGLHKDGLIFLGLALIVYHVYFGLKERRFILLRLLPSLLGLILVLGIRSYILIPLVPALIAFVLASTIKWKPIFTFSAVYLVFAILFFTAKYIHPSLNFPEKVVQKQRAFFELQGGSTVNLNHLEPTFTSFIINAPQSLNLTAIRPYPADVRHLLSLAAAIEINFLLLLFIIFIIWRRKENGTIKPIILFSLFFAFSLLITIGYTVNNLGAIVRYRSIALPFLMIPIIANINWSRISGLLVENFNFKNNT